MSVLDRLRRKSPGQSEEENALSLVGKFNDHPHLEKLRPREGFEFGSDYFVSDHARHGVVLDFFHSEHARESLRPFWGAALLPTGLSNATTLVLVEQIQQQTESWVKARIKTSERLQNVSESDSGDLRSSRAVRRISKVGSDLDVITTELDNGAEYLKWQGRLVVKTPSLEELDEATKHINARLTNFPSTVSAAARVGLQKQELEALLVPTNARPGRGWGFTTTEFAGMHHLVTDGLNDPRGVYVGAMTRDINNSGILWDTDRYGHHVVIADEAFVSDQSVGGTGEFSAQKSRHGGGRLRMSDVWAARVSQAALLANERVVHLVLNGADMRRLGPAMESMTSYVHMNDGALNPFEMFGSVEDELGIFAAQQEKLVLLASQAQELSTRQRGIVVNQLKQQLERFYIGQGMWYHNAKENRNKLRVVGIPHEQVPDLKIFVAYLEQNYKAMTEQKDQSMTDAANELRGIFSSLLTTNGDLFDVKTSSAVDSAHDARRVVYDFSALRRRGEGIAMAQLVNVLGFAVNGLSAGDVVIIHGAEHINSEVRRYASMVFDTVYERGVRVCFSYDSVEKMLMSSDFNRLDSADWSLLGKMTPPTVSKFIQALGQDLPADLRDGITSTQQTEAIAYLRRGYDNVLFTPDVQLFPKKKTPRAVAKPAKRLVRV